MGRVPFLYLALNLNQTQELEERREFADVCVTNALRAKGKNLTSLSSFLLRQAQKLEEDLSVFCVPKQKFLSLYFHAPVQG